MIYPETSAAGTSAERIWCLHRERISVAGGKEIHPFSGRASPDPVISGRIRGDAQSSWAQVRRKIHLEMTEFMPPLRGWIIPSREQEACASGYIMSPLRGCRAATKFI